MVGSAPFCALCMLEGQMGPLVCVHRQRRLYERRLARRSLGGELVSLIGAPLVFLGAPEQCFTLILCPVPGGAVAPAGCPDM